MRYLGNKTRLLEFIEKVLIKYNIDGDTFLDLFAGTGAVGDYLKGRYKIISNDYMYFSSVINKAKLKNSTIPTFEVFNLNFNMSPFDWLNSKEYIPDDSYFIYNHYAPQGGRQYFTNENAIKIDGMRQDIEKLFKSGILKSNEYEFLLASLIESVTRFSNTSGTYQAFLKQWDSRALKEFHLEPLIMFPSLSVDSENKVFNENSNLLVRDFKEADIVYIDPPYTITQYTNSYHILETIAKYDNPAIFGKTGRRVNREFSGYSNKSKAIYEFEDLLRQVQIKTVLISYSNHSIVPLEKLVEIAKKFAVNGKVYIEKYEYRSYATNNKSYKEAKEGLQEVIIYFEKEVNVKKSPLNYSGSKDAIIQKIFKYLPKHVGTFVDAMGGAFNVGLNVTAIDKVVYNEFNYFIYNILKMLYYSDKDGLIKSIEDIVNKFELSKKNKEKYMALREYYNISDKSSLILYVLQIYSFQNMIRFNQKHQMNVPVGNNEFNRGTKARILNFQANTDTVEFLNEDYLNLPIEKFDKDTVFYFDPPYFITNAEYNDGKRGHEGWNIKKEQEMFEFLSMLNRRGYKFMLSNVLYHKGKTHINLLNWVKENNFNIYDLGKTGIKYPRLEVLITNYNDFY